MLSSLQLQVSMSDDLLTWVQEPSAMGFSILTATLITAVIYSIWNWTRDDYVVINRRKWFELTDANATKRFLVHARAYLQTSHKTTPNKPFRVIADVGDTLVLPNSYADEVRNLRDLDNDAVSRKDFHTHLSSFASFKIGVDGSGLSKSVVQKQLTQSLGLVTDPLSTECAMALREVLSDDKGSTRSPNHNVFLNNSVLIRTDTPYLDWHLVSPLRDAVLMIVARLSSKVFLGEELCHNKEWLKITTEHTTTAFQAVEELRLWPTVLRPVVHWFLPSCRLARAQIARSREIINPVLEERRETRRQGGERPHDGIEWFESNAKGRDYDPALAQLNLSIAAMHTTTDLLMQTILDIARHPEIVEPLRQEIRGALDEHGWEKTALYKMKLLDSAIKETQRIKPIQMISMRRLPLRDITLSDGTPLRKGREVVVAANRMWDESVYSDPERWDPYRFYRMRAAPGSSSEHTTQLVSTSADHLGFGHGQHACPGRFFAANEVKVALAQLLLEYDWKLPEGADASYLQHGWSMVANPFVGVMFRRREKS
ncbi:putative cytochrome P450 monooxygenase [Xylariaceae sp. FL1272]|nr:putative cytochrome P450 monooxygenase [Xylariaceae sp. FL1272]